MGPVLPIWAVYATGVVAMGVLHSTRLIDLTLPHPASLLAPGAAAATLSIIAFLALTTGVATGRVAIVVVLSSLTSAVTVILARVLEHARMAWHQWLAIASVVIGLCLMRQ
jgi:drug/metabolite transporter (DMT)-like permease